MNNRQINSHFIQHSFSSHSAQYLSFLTRTCLCILISAQLLGQTVEIGNTVFNAGGSGVTGTLNTTENYRYQHTVSIGEPFIGTVSLSDQGSTTLGQFSFYNLQTDNPVLTASEGDFPDRVKLEWGVKTLQPPIQNGVKIYRDGELKAKFGYGIKEWEDRNVFPGEVYVYEVVAENHYGSGRPGGADGFVNPNGLITGKIQTVHNTPVYGVEVAIEPYFGKTLQFDGENDYVKISDSEGLDGMSALTLSAWIKPADTTLALQDIIVKGVNNYLLRIDGGGNLVGAVNDYPVTASGIIRQGEWQYVAFTWDGDSGTAKLYHNGVEVNSGHLPVSKVIVNDSPVYFGSYNESGEYFQGHIDEIRIWNTVRDSAQIRDNMYRVMDSKSSGLVAEWRFDEGIGDKVFDITAASCDGYMFGPVWSDDNPDIHNSAFTDMEGNYKIESIFYESDGTVFTVTPQKPWHEFKPANRQVTLSVSSTAADNVEFVDDSQIEVSGHINFYGTSCFVKGVEIMEEISNSDGTVDTLSLQPPVFTNSDGYYICEFEPGTAHKLIPRLGEHSFIDQSYETGVIVMPQADINFEDTQTYSLFGSVTGGSCGLPLGEEFQVIINTQPSCYKDSVPTDGSGYFSFKSLPAQHYEVTVHSENPQYEFDGQQADLVSSDDTVNFVHRDSLQLEVKGLPVNQCGMTVLQQSQGVDITLHVFEEYSGKRCYVNNISFSITDEISDRQDAVNFDFADATFDASSPDSLPTYKIVPGCPNFLSGKDHPYQKLITITARDENGREVSESFWAYVEGHKPREKSFASRLPELPLHILHDPPGDASYVQLDHETSTFTAHSISAASGIAENKWVKVELGTEFETGFGISTKSKVWCSGTATFAAEYSLLSTEEWGVSLSTTEVFKTSDSEQIIGEEGDVYIGGAMNVLYGLTDVLKVENCEVVKDTTIWMAPNGFETFYIYTESHIVNDVIPGLLVLGDTASAELWSRIVADNHAQKDSADILRNVSISAGASYERTEEIESTHTKSIDFQVEINRDVALEAGFEYAGAGVSGGYMIAMKWTDGVSTTVSETDITKTKYVIDDNDTDDSYNISIKRDRIYGTPVFEIIAGVTSCPWEPGTLKREQVQLMMDNYAAVNVPPDEPAVFTLYAGNNSENNEEREYFLRLINASNPFGALLRVGAQGLGSAALSYQIPAGEQQTLTLTVERGPNEYEYDDLQIMLYSACEYAEWESTGRPIPKGLADTVTFSVHYIEPCGGDIRIAWPKDGWVGNAGDSTLFFNITGYNRFDQSLARIIMEYRHSDGAMTSGAASFAGGAIQQPVKNGKFSATQSDVTKLPRILPAMREDEWFVADTIDVDSLDQDYYAWQWDISFLDDGCYEVRAVGECVTGELSISEPVAGLIDRKHPEVFGDFYPPDGVLNADDEIRVVFEEPVNCSYLTPDLIHLYNTSFGMDVAMDYDCRDDEIVVVPDVQNYFIENCYLKLTIDKVWDLQGNKTDSPIEYEFFVDRNPIHWNQDRLREVVYIGEDKTITTTLHNPGSDGSPFTFTGQPWFLYQQATALPWWLKIDPPQGDLNPGGELPVEITVSGMLNPGEYEETFYAHTAEGDEPLTLSVRSLCTPPVWEFDEQAYQYSMNLNCQISVRDTLSEDEYDIVGAFVDDDCRGYAPVERVLLLSEPYDSTWTDDQGVEHTHVFVDTLMDKYMSFLTIHSNVQSGGTVHFRIWDASECEEYWEIEQHIPFIANSVSGAPESPVVLNATGAVAQFITLEKGWSWFSIHLNHNENWLNVNQVFSHEEHFTSGARIIHQNAFETYSESTEQWLPGALTLDPREMYMTHLDTLTMTTIIGHEINPDSLEFTLHPNWNWLGYPLRFNHDVNEALKNLPAADGSVIKSETQFVEYVASTGKWIGSLQWMIPGQGYLFKSTAPETLTFTYSGLGAGQGDRLARVVADAEIETVETPWSFNPKNFRYNMPFVGKINPAEELSGQIAVAATVDHEIRGIARRIYEPSLKEFRIYLMVHSNKISGETVTFRIYDYETEKEYFAKETVSFNESGMAGSVLDPIPLTKAAAVIPEEYSLSQNYPNPFNPVTTITFGIPEESDVVIDIYNIMGQKVRTLVSERRQPGCYSVRWDSKNDAGRSMSTGMYICRMRAGSFQQIRKMVLLK